MDFDADGILDLVSGSYCSDSTGIAPIFLFRALAPGRFAAPRELTTANGAALSAGAVDDFAEGTEHFRRPNATEPWFEDWDGDGRRDLLVGDRREERVLPADADEAVRTRFARLQERLQPLEQRVRAIEADRDARMAAAGHRMRGVFAETYDRMESLVEEVDAIREELTELCGPPRIAGQVWLYLRRR